MNEWHYAGILPHILTTWCFIKDRDYFYLHSVVGIATRNGLHGPGIEFRCRQDFSYPSRPTMGTTQPPVQRVLGLFLGSKTAMPWRWPPTPSSIEVNEGVELYIYCPSGNSWLVTGWNLPFALLRLLKSHAEDLSKIYVYELFTKQQFHQFHAIYF